MDAARLSGSTSAHRTPQLAIWNSAALSRAKARLAAGDPALKPALDKLRREADTALTVGPFSVMDKKLAPPSGDKHDYMSVGPYWWPDPSKPDGLPYIRRDGEVNPDRSDDRTDAQALGKMTGNVETLALAYYFTGHEPYAVHAARLLRTWFLDPATKMNPNLNFGQGIPGRTDGRPIGIIDTAGWVTLLDAVVLLHSSPAWSGEDQASLVKWFQAYLHWLRTSPLGLGEETQANNHGTHYDAQVVRFALFVGDDELARQIIERSKSKRIATQIEPDGRQPHELSRTKSFSYSAMNLRGFFHLAAMGQRLGIDLWNYQTGDGRGLRKALDYLAAYADDQVAWPHEQIGAKGTEYRLAILPLLRVAADVYREQRYESLTAKLPKRPVAEDRASLLYGPSSPSRP